MTIDLASKYSAYMVTESTGKVIFQADSIGISPKELVDDIAYRAKFCDLILIEDVPYGISSQAMIKPVLRLQGMLLRALEDSLAEVLFVNPSSWQKYYPGVGRGKAEERVEAARVHAEELGYTPPNLVNRYIAELPEGTKVLKKHTKIREKVMTDYIDAFLMAKWVYSFEDIRELRKASGVQPPYI